MASQTHWSLQLSWALICWGLCPWLLASRIWQRRRVKASEDRKPCFRVTSSSGLSSPTITDLMPVGCQVFLPCQPFNREFALATTAWQVISTFSSKYLLIISVTLSIVCGPYRFGDSIADSQIELRKTILYTLESYPAFLVLGVTVPLPS